MKKFIALLISVSMIAAPVVFAADEQAGNQDATMQQMTSQDQAAAKPVAKKKGHRSCHCKKKCAHKRPVKKTTKVAAPVAPAVQ